jgi:hypothetical protein
MVTEKKRGENYIEEGQERRKHRHEFQTTKTNREIAIIIPAICFVRWQMKNFT